MKKSLLTDTHVLAWATLVKATNQALAAIEKDLFSSGNISLTWYDILVAVEQAQSDQVSMTEVARQIILSKSALCRSVEKLIQHGYLVKNQADTDKRVFHLSITQKGRQALKDAWPVYRSGIEQYFARFISKSNANELTSVLHPIIHPPVELKI